MCCDIFRTTLFLERLIFTLFQIDYFDTTATFSEQIFFQNSFFLLFQNSDFFAAVIFSEYSLFQSENSTEQPLLENKKFFMAVTFRDSCFSLFKIKISKKELLFHGRYFATRYQLFQKSYILEKTSFSEKQYSALPASCGELLF